MLGCSSLVIQKRTTIKNVKIFDPSFYTLYTTFGSIYCYPESQIHENIKPTIYMKVSIFKDHPINTVNMRKSVRFALGRDGFLRLWPSGKCLSRKTFLDWNGNVNSCIDNTMGENLVNFSQERTHGLHGAHFPLPIIQYFWVLQSIPYPSFNAAESCMLLVKLSRSYVL